MDTRPTDAYSPYEHGVRQLLYRLGNDHPRSQEAHTYRQELSENLALLRRYGDTEARRATRANIIERFNELSCSELGIPFDRLCSTVFPQQPDDPLSADMDMDTPLTRLNPFSDTGRITDPDRFFDRKALLQQIFDALGQKKNLSLVGRTKIGKSSLLAMIGALGPQRLNLPPDTFASLPMQRIESEQEFYEMLCTELKIETVGSDSLAQVLCNQYRILCLDDIDKVRWEGFTARICTQLQGLTQGPEASLTIVTTSQIPLEHVFESHFQAHPELQRMCTRLDIEPFSPEGVGAFLAHRLRGTEVQFSEEEVAWLQERSQGHPAMLQYYAADLYRKSTFYTIESSAGP